MSRNTSFVTWAAMVLSLMGFFSEVWPGCMMHTFGLRTETKYIIIYIGRKRVEEMMLYGEPTTKGQELVF